VYIVNRRTVVDQATDEAKRIRDRLQNPEKFGSAPILQQLGDALRTYPSVPAGEPLAVSTLRGQLADNGEWRKDPARPAVIIGTIDIIGSRLLFSGYGVGFRSRPLHAGLLGQDALIVHDEAHLSPAFQSLLEGVAREQGRTGDRRVRPLQVMELTATSRSGGQEAFQLGPEDEKDPTVLQRVTARKGIVFHEVGDERALAPKVGELAKAYESSGKAILVYLRTLDAVSLVHRQIEEHRSRATKNGDSRRHVAVLTGTLRGRERDRMVSRDPVFARFVRKPEVEPVAGTAYLISTSAGEVGVDLSADHLVCDLTPFDSMAQRFGRLNRFGDGDSRIDVVYEGEPKKKDGDSAYERARLHTLALLQQLSTRSDGCYDASLQSLMQLRVRADLSQAFSPTPRILPLDDILLDAWSLTTIRNDLPGRPPVEPWLHGMEENQIPETYVAWRAEVELLGPENEDAFITDLLDDYPLKPHELLRDRSDRVRKNLETLSHSQQDRPVWLLDVDGTVERLTLRRLVERNPKNTAYAVDLAYRTVVLSPRTGGLREAGVFDAGERFFQTLSYDVADELADEQGPLRARFRGTLGEMGWQWEPVGSTAEQYPKPDSRGRIAGWKLVREIALAEDEDGNPISRLLFLKRIRGADADAASSWSAPREELLTDHLVETTRVAERLASCVGLDEDLRAALTLAAKWHDRGKDRSRWQRAMGNQDQTRILAKTAHGRPPENLCSYRHEFGSLVDVEAQEEFLRQPSAVQDLILHLIAAHHGRGRPFFPVNEAYDPNAHEEIWVRIAQDVPRRFARLQQRFGRWGLAWLESLLRAADALASETGITGST
jgi:CRISPR-associated endonuclease/helicase Cas3